MSSVWLNIGRTLTGHWWPHFWILLQQENLFCLWLLNLLCCWAKGSLTSMRKDFRSLLHVAQQGASLENMLLSLVQWILLWASFHLYEVLHFAVAALKLERETVQIICAELVFPYSYYFGIVTRSQYSLQKMGSRFPHEAMRQGVIKEDWSLTTVFCISTRCRMSF